MGGKRCTSQQVFSHCLFCSRQPIRIEAVRVFDERVIEAAVRIRVAWLNELMLWITELGTTAVLLPLLLLTGAALYMYKKTPDVVFFAASLSH